MDRSRRRSRIPAAFYNPGQENCNREAEIDELMTDDGQFAGATDILPITDADFLAAADLGLQCNDGLVGARHRWLRGDACDPIACAPTETTYTDVTDQFEPPAFGICGVTGYAICTNVTYEMPAGFEMRPITQAADGGTQGEIGLRFCACDAERDTPAERRINCGASTTFNCAIDGDAFAQPGSSWETLTVGDPSVTATFGPAGSQPKVSTTWDFLTDLVALTGWQGPLPPDGDWQLDGDGNLIGGPSLAGILWSHVPIYDGATAGSIPDDGSRSFDEIASWYGEADTAFQFIMHWKKIPRYKPAWPWEYCAKCALELPWAWVLDVQSHAVAGVGPDGSQDVGALFDDDAVALLGGDGLRVGASEPEHRLGSTTRRELVVGSSLSPIGALHVDDGQVIGETFGGAFAPADVSTGSPVYAYSALRDELWTIATLRSGENRLSRWTRGRGWEPVALTGERLLEPVALTFRLEDDALYLLDRVAGDRVIRLVRIDLVSLAARVIEPRLVDAAVASVSLSIGLDGNLLLAVGTSSPAETRLARLAVEDGALRTIVETTTRDVLYGAAREVRGGVAFLKSQARSFTPVIVPLTQQ